MHGVREEREKVKAAERKILYIKCERERKSLVVCGVTEKIRHQMQEEEPESTWLTLCSDRKHMYEEKTSGVSVWLLSFTASLPEGLP